MNRNHTLSSNLNGDIRAGVVAHIIRFDLLRRQEFRDSFLSIITLDQWRKRAGHRSRNLWDVVVARSEAYLVGRMMSTSEIHLVTGMSRATAGRCLGILVDLGIFQLQTDAADKRRKLVNLSEFSRTTLDRYVQECFEEFKELISHHHDRERHKAEDALKVSEISWKSLTDESPDFVFLVDTNLIIQFVNHPTMEMSREQITGQPIYNLLSEAEREDSREIFESVVRTGEPASYESTHQATNGRWYFFESRIVRRVIDDTVIGLTVHARDVTKKRRLEENLRISEARFDRAVRGSMDGIWDHDLVTGEKFCSPQLKVLLGYDESELDDISTKYLELIHPDDRDKRQKATEETIRNQTPYDVEYRIRTKQNEYRWFHSRAQVSCDDEGVPTRLSGSVRDVTERRMLEENLRKSEERFRATFEQAAVGIAHVARDGRFLRLNQRFCDIAGYAHDDLITGAFQDITHPADLALDQENMDKLLTGENSSFSREKRYIRANKTVVWANLTVALIRDQDGKPGYFVSVIEDINERKVLDAALREGEERFRLVAQTAADAIIVADQEGKVTFWNASAQRIFGYEESEIIGHSLAKLMPETSRPYHKEYLKRAADSGHLRLHDKARDVVALSKSGHEIPISLSLSRYIANGQTFFTAIIQDIDERKRSEQKLLFAKKEAEKANKAKSAFLANMSHDLRTPLNAIIGFSEVMIEQTFGSLGDSHYEEYARDIRDSGNLLIDLIDDVLDISKIEAGKYKFSEENINIPKLVQTSIKMLSKQAEDMNIRVVDSCKPDLPLFRGDGKAIIQILNNLLSNAIKFTPQGGEVRVNAWKRRDGRFCIQISDTGIGISEENLVKALAPFERVETQSSDMPQGTGLGLHLCSLLVDLHDGEMVIESEVGLGTSVTLNFPRERVLVT